MTSYDILQFMSFNSLIRTIGYSRKDVFEDDSRKPEFLVRYENCVNCTELQDNTNTMSVVSPDHMLKLPVSYLVVHSPDPEPCVYKACRLWYPLEYLRITGKNINILRCIKSLYALSLSTSEIGALDDNILTATVNRLNIRELRLHGFTIFVLDSPHMPSLKLLRLSQCNVVESIYVANLNLEVLELNEMAFTFTSHILDNIKKLDIYMCMVYNAIETDSVDPRTIVFSRCKVSLNTLHDIPPNVTIYIRHGVYRIGVEDIPYDNDLLQDLITQANGRIIME